MLQGLIELFLLFLKALAFGKDVFSGSIFQMADLKTLIWIYGCSCPVIMALLQETLYE